MKKLALLIIIGSSVVPNALPQVKHVEMRVEGMT
jgi:hypothetical protein